MVLATSPVQDVTTPGAGTVTAPGNQTLTQMFSSSAITQLMPIANSYAPVLNYAISFFSNPNPTNQQATLSALDILGMPTYYPGDVYRSHNGWCAAYRPLNDLYFLALLLLKYPMVEKTATNCRAIGGYITALDQERIAADSKYAADNEPCTHTSAINAVTTLQGIYRGMYAGMTCDYMIQQQTQQQQDDEAQAVMDHAAQLQLQAQATQANIAADAAQNATALLLQSKAADAANTANVAGTGNQGTNSYLVYGIIGAAVLLLVGAVMIFKHKNND